MLRTRLWMGAVLIALAVGVLWVDQQLAPWYPFLFVVLAGLALAACAELLHLLGPGRRPRPGLSYLAVLALVGANWPAHLVSSLGTAGGAWLWIAGTFAAVVLGGFLVEMAAFHESGTAVPRLALLTWVAAYLGVLSAFFAQLRWLDNPGQGSVALALAIFVPKCCDIGAYFTGRLLGRHRLTPVLSPNETWEGAVGGLVAAALVAVALNQLEPVVRGGFWVVAGFGLTVGLAGLIGDLAESLIKRDCRQKDASHLVPGFGGVLDVVDSILFAAPVTYAWLVWQP